MNRVFKFLAIAVLAGAVSGCAGQATSPVMAPGPSNEDIIARHMVGEAMLAAQFVAAAEKSGMRPARINAVLKDIAALPAIALTLAATLWLAMRRRAAMA